MLVGIFSDQHLAELASSSFGLRYCRKNGNF
jgi:hypothetical protein